MQCSMLTRCMLSRKGDLRRVAFSKGKTPAAQWHPLPTLNIIHSSTHQLNPSYVFNKALRSYLSCFSFLLFQATLQPISTPTPPFYTESDRINVMRCHWCCSVLCRGLLAAALLASLSIKTHRKVGQFALGVSCGSGGRAGHLLTRKSAVQFQKSLI